MEGFILENGKEGKFHIFVELKKNIGNYETVSISGSLSVQIESDKKFAQEFEKAFTEKIFPAIKVAAQHAIDDVVKDLAKRIANIKKVLEQEQNPLRRKKLMQILDELVERFYQLYDFSDLEFAKQVESGQYTGGE
ncbi:MAG: hypothetical protein QXE80_03525 [Pyrobaculum sp.]